MSNDVRTLLVYSNEHSDDSYLALITRQLTIDYENWYIVLL